MLRLSYRMVIDAPVNRIFSYAAAVDHLPEWLLRGVALSYPDIESTGGKGSAFEFKRPVEGGVKTVRCEVAEIVLNERLAWDELLLPFMRHRRSLKLQASNGSTLVTIGEEYLPTNPIGWLFMPLFLVVYAIVLLLWPLTRWHGRLPLRRLKERVEVS